MEIRLNKNNIIKLSAFLVIFSLILLIYLFPTFLSQKQKQTYTSLEFVTPNISAPNSFISIWNTAEDGVTGSNQLQLPLQSTGTYNFLVNWGDTTNDTITNWNQTERTHTYASEGEYTIAISGIIIGWRFNGGDRDKIIEIQQWGCLRLGNSGGYFDGCTNLKLTATDNLNLTGTTNLGYAFRDCLNLGGSGNMNGWNTSMVTSMAYMFSGASSFNQPIGSWDVSRVTNMAHMFSGASSFIRLIGSWDVSSVTDMSYMFFEDPSFNQLLDSWVVSNVITMRHMFDSASSFNTPLGSWDVSSVTDMSHMFFEALSFNWPIGSWNVSSVTDMSYMFYNAASFNQPLGSWDVSSVTDMEGLFANAWLFNQPLGSWNVSHVTDMLKMFYQIKLTPSNYDNLLLGWSQLNLQLHVNLEAGYSRYSSTAVDARRFIIDNFLWNIDDGGLYTPQFVIPSYNIILVIAVCGVTIALISKKKIEMNYQT